MKAKDWRAWVPRTLSDHFSLQNAIWYLLHRNIKVFTMIDVVNKLGKYHLDSLEVVIKSDISNDRLKKEY